MQWSAGKNKGFSTVDPKKLWLPVDARDDAPNVADAEKNKESLVHVVRKLIDLRCRHKALSAHADFVPLIARENTYPFVYQRSSESETVVVALNPADRPVSVGIPLSSPLPDPTLLMGTGVRLTVRAGVMQLNMEGKSYGVYATGAPEGQ
jgi:maltose alpha-D-glucosyltransferase/alpha-amylase